MRPRFPTLFLACAALFAPATAEAPPQTGTLLIRVANIVEIEGEMRIALFDSKGNWLGEALLFETIPVDGAACEWRVDNVPFGEYAAAAHHDRNANAKNDRTFIGLPTEAYGFSNNARRRLGPAKWDAAKFRVDSELTEIEFDVR